MKYFLHTIKGVFKKPTQNKTKLLRKRGKDRVRKGLERGFLVFSLGEFFCYFF